jgi:hypothetical protein
LEYLQLEETIISNIEQLGEAAQEVAKKLFNFDLYKQTPAERLTS